MNRLASPTPPIGDTDPLTGTERPWTFQGWPNYVEWCRRARKETPWMLRNAIAWRAEKAREGPWPGDRFDRDIAEAQILVQLALATLVEQEVL